MKELINKNSYRNTNTRIIATIILLIIVLGIFFIKEPIGSNVFKGSKINNNEIDGTERLITLELRKNGEYGFKTSDNDFTIIIEETEESYGNTLNERVNVPELAEYDFYRIDGVSGLKAVKHKRIFKNGELYKEVPLSETILVEAMPSISFYGTKPLMRYPYNVMKSLMVYSKNSTDSTYTDLTYKVRNDGQLLDVYRGSNKYMTVDYGYIHFMSFPSDDEFKSLLEIIGYDNDKITEMMKVFKSIKTEQFVFTETYAMKYDGNFSLVAPVRNQHENESEYYKLFDYAALYEKYGKNNQ